jgi:hypothetical protein
VDNSHITQHLPPPRPAPEAAAFAAFLSTACCTTLNNGALFKVSGRTNNLMWLPRRYTCSSFDLRPSLAARREAIRVSWCPPQTPQTAHTHQHTPHPRGDSSYNPQQHEVFHDTPPHSSSPLSRCAPHLHAATLLERLPCCQGLDSPRHLLIVTDAGAAACRCPLQLERRTTTDANTSLQ